MHYNHVSMLDGNLQHVLGLSFGYPWHTRDREMGRGLWSKVHDCRATKREGCNSRTQLMLAIIMILLSRQSEEIC